ncbi:hypothetical protein AB0M20_24750, partial [Actinoplanes sp. NPDC051633]|uniref:hypothetical protein n=1 Tax=Actinoplanes sp. NPDC051633 TaxID=3155670 RepID=UPI003447A1B2
MADTTIIDDVREQFGPRFVPARLEAEAEARQFLNDHVGSMDAGQIVDLGRLFNRHEKAGRTRQDRFTPGFTGAIMAKLGNDAQRFNHVVAELWRSPMPNALDLLGQIYADRSIFPHAGSSLPSMLLYLRDSERFGICVNATMNGLRALTGIRYRALNREHYERFCTDLRAWREENGVAPQEADAILTNLMRAARAETDPPPITRALSLSAEEVAAACYLSVEQIDQWVEALHTGMKQAVFHGPPGTGQTFV